MLKGQMEPACQPIIAMAGDPATHDQVLWRLRRADGRALDAAVL